MLASGLELRTIGFRRQYEVRGRAHTPVCCGFNFGFELVLLACYAWQGSQRYAVDQ